MAQVLAISTETPKAPSENATRREATDFNNYLEKEKARTAMPPFFNMNFSSFFNVPMGTGDLSDQKVSSISSRLGLDERSSTSKSDANDHSSLTNNIKDDQASKTNDNSQQTKITENKNYNKNVAQAARSVASDLEFTPEIYNAVITAKNKIASLRAIDTDMIISQINDKIKFLRSGGKIEISVALKPDELGSILMTITSNKGLLTINIFAEQQSKAAILENIKELERALNASGLKIAAINIVSAVAEDKKQSEQST